MIRASLLAAAVAALLALPATATAVVPPKNCGMMTVKAKRYQVKDARDFLNKIGVKP